MSTPYACHATGLRRWTLHLSPILRLALRPNPQTIKTPVISRLLIRALKGTSLVGGDLRMMGTIRNQQGQIVMPFSGLAEVGDQVEQNPCC